MRTTATTIATRTAPRTSQRVQLQPARPCCCCSRYVLIPLLTRLATQTVHRLPFSYALLTHAREWSMTRGRPNVRPRTRDHCPPDAALESRLRIAQGLPRARALTLPRERPSCGVEDSFLLAPPLGVATAQANPLMAHLMRRGPSCFVRRLAATLKARSLWGEAELLGLPSLTIFLGVFSRGFSRGVRR
jgi:hypothetical protein